MDTNAKGFRYSPANKILCVALSFVCIVAAMGLGSTATILLDSEYLNEYSIGNTDEINFTCSTRFESEIRDDICGIIYQATINETVKDLQEKLKQEKEKAVNDVYKQFVDYNYYWDYTDDFLYCDIEVNGSSYEFAVGVCDILDCLETDDNLKDFDINNYSEQITDCISSQYDSFVECEVSEVEELNYFYYNPDNYNDSLNLMAVYNNINEHNFVFTKDNALAAEIHYIYENGNVEASGMPQEVVDYITSECFESNYAKHTNVYLYFNEMPTFFQFVKNFKYYDDTYFTLKNIFDLSAAVNNHEAVMLAAAAVLLIISLICGFNYFMITGKSSKSDKARLILIDKLAFIIHFLIIVGIGFAAGCIFDCICSEIQYYSSIALILILMLTAFVYWALLIEFCASVARCVHSGHIKDRLISIKLYGALKKLNKKVRKAVTYKPKMMKWYVFAAAAAYFLINSLLIILAQYAAIGISILIYIIVFAISAAAIYFTVKYIINLDKIVFCAVNHMDFTGDPEKLPPLLKALVDGMRYTNEQMQTAVDKAVKDERLKTELITNISHDLKTPLTSIINYVDLLGKCDEDNEKTNEYIAVLDEKSNKLKRLIDDLIEASKATSGNVTLERAKLNLNELCLQAVGENQAEFEKAQLKIIVNEANDAPIIFADGKKTYRIIENLFSNAQKYSAAPSRVYISVYNDGNMGVFEIKNISAEPLNISPDELTERFVRGDKSRNREGNGLGLSIADGLCRAQGGRLEITIDGDLFKAKVYLPKA